MPTKSQRIHEKRKQTKSSAPVKLNWTSQIRSKSKPIYSILGSRKCYRVIKLGKGGLNYRVARGSLIDMAV